MSRSSVRILIVSALAVALAALAVRGSDPPHWSSTTKSIDCSQQCHTQHAAPGGNLTQAASNVNLCQSCHNGSGLAMDLPVNTSDMATPGISGIHHGFDVAVANAAAGAQSPGVASPLYPYVTSFGNRVVCSTCHNQHASVSSLGGTPRVSAAKKTTALGSTGAVSSGGTYTGANGSWYLVEIQTAGTQATARFRYSKDNGVSWMASNVPAGTGVVLDSGITATFGAGNYAVGERWEFYGAWPFLRIALDSGDNATGTKFCRDCHAPWTMDHTGVETYTGTARSHPVGVILNANGRAYDRAVPLDGNGGTQGGGSADANPSNDLKLDVTGRIQCITCHAPHYAPSNTSAVIP